MKDEWDKLHIQINDHADDLQVFIKNTTGIASKNLNKLAVKYNKLLVQAEKFAGIVNPIAPRQVDMPFKTEEFAEAWSDYREYLIEQHQVHLASRTEIYMLKKLKQWANKSPARAIDILDFLAMQRYKSFFCPSEKQLNGEELPLTEQNTSSINLNINPNAGV